MSDLGGLASSRVSGDSAQRPIEGNQGVNPEQPYGWARKDSSCSDFKGTQTRVNADEVIT